DCVKQTRTITAAEAQEHDTSSVLAGQQDAVPAERSRDRLDANRAQWRLKGPEPLAEHPAKDRTSELYPDYAFRHKKLSSWPCRIRPPFNGTPQGQAHAANEPDPRVSHSPSSQATSGVTDERSRSQAARVLDRW